MESTLTHAALQEKLSKTRDKGGAERNILGFIESGDAWVDVRTFSNHSAKPQDSLYNSYNGNVKKLAKAAEEAGKEFPELKVVKIEDTVAIINVPVFAAQEEAA